MPQKLHRIQLLDAQSPFLLWPSMPCDQLFMTFTCCAWPLSSQAFVNSLSTGLHFRKKKNRTEWTVVCFLAFKHQGTVVLFKIVNYVCLRKCQCFLKQNNRVGKDWAELFVAKVSCRKNDVFIVMGTGEGSGDWGTMHSQFFYRGWRICFLSSPNYLSNAKVHKLWPREISSPIIKTWNIPPRIKLTFFFIRNKFTSDNSCHGCLQLYLMEWGRWKSVINVQKLLQGSSGFNL